MTAAAHKLARIVCHMVTNKKEYGATAFQDQERKTQDRKPINPLIRVLGPTVIAFPGWQPPPSRETTRVRIQLTSPLRLGSGGKLIERAGFVEFARALFRRIHILASLYSRAAVDRGWSLDLINHAAVRQATPRNWCYVREARTSGSQHSRVVMDGILGD